MSAKKLGRVTAGLCVALSLALGGYQVAVSGGTGAAVAAHSTTIGAPIALIDFEWG